MVTKKQKELVESGNYKKLNNPFNRTHIPVKYKEFIIKYKREFYCLNEMYKEIQDRFNWTDEQIKEYVKQIRSENHKKYWVSVEHSEIGNKISNARMNMSEEDKLLMKQHFYETVNNRTQEKKNEISQNISNSRKNYFKNITDEERIRYSESRKETWVNKSEEEMNRISEIQKEISRNRSDEEKERINELRRNYTLSRDKEWYNDRYEKLKKSNLEKYGVENQFQRQDIVDKIKDTKLEKYGSLSLGVKVNYKYNDIKFDSSTELYYYIYNHEILKNNITRGKNFEYFIDGISHIYECDFLVNDENVEIKGNYLINENMELIDFFGDGHILKEKTQCMRDNNVKIILSDSDEMKEIIKIVDEKFPNLVESCKVTNQSENSSNDIFNLQ